MPCVAQEIVGNDLIRKISHIILRLTPFKLQTVRQSTSLRDHLRLQPRSVANSIPSITVYQLPNLHHPHRAVLHDLAATSLLVHDNEYIVEDCFPR